MHTRPSRKNREEVDLHPLLSIHLAHEPTIVSQASESLQDPARNVVVWDTLFSVTLEYPDRYIDRCLKDNKISFNLPT